MRAPAATTFTVDVLLEEVLTGTASDWPAAARALADKIFRLRGWVAAMRGERDTLLDALERTYAGQRAGDALIAAAILRDPHVVVTLRKAGLSALLGSGQVANAATALIAADPSMASRRMGFRLPSLKRRGRPKVHSDEHGWLCEVLAYTTASGSDADALRAWWKDVRRRANKRTTERTLIAELPALKKRLSVARKRYGNPR